LLVVSVSSAISSSVVAVVDDDDEVGLHQKQIKIIVKN
jgi:hypothetical protein